LTLQNFLDRRSLYDIQNFADDAVTMDVDRLDAFASDAGLPALAGRRLHAHLREGATHATGGAHCSGRCRNNAAHEIPTILHGASPRLAIVRSLS
jgi:hypothetical protein